MRHLLTLTAALTMVASAAIAAEINYKFETTNGAGEQVYVVQKEWADGIEAASNGRFKIDLLPMDAVVKPQDLLQAVADKTLHGSLSTPELFAGEDPGFGLIGNTISAWASDEDILKFYYYGGGLKVADEIMKEWGVKVFGVAVTGSESFVSKKPIRNIAEFKGVKMRAPTGPVTQLFSIFGAAPVFLPGSEVYTSLEKGVIDAADYSNFANNQKQGVNDIAKFPIYPGFHSSPTIFMQMNLEEWEKLNPNDQEFMKRYAKGLALDSLISAHYQDRLAVGEALAKGITPVAWDEAELAKVRAIAKQIWQDTAAKSEIGKKYMDALMAYLKSQGQL